MVADAPTNQDNVMGGQRFAPSKFELAMPGTRPQTTQTALPNRQFVETTIRIMAKKKDSDLKRETPATNLIMSKTFLPMLEARTLE